MCIARVCGLVILLGAATIGLAARLTFAASGERAAVLLAEAPQGTVYWHGQLLKPPIRFTQDPGTNEMLVNGLSLARRSDWTPPATVDSTAVAQFRVLENAREHVKSLTVEGVGGVALAESVATSVRRSSSVVDSVKVIGEALAIFWSGWRDSEYVPLTALSGRGPQIDWREEQRSLAKFYAQFLSEGGQLVFDDRGVILSRGNP